MVRKADLHGRPETRGGWSMAGFVVAGVLVMGPTWWAARRAVAATEAPATAPSDMPASRPKDEQLPTLATLLDRLQTQGDAKTREEAARALGELKDTAAVEALIKALKDEESGVRGEAARALGQIGDARAVDPLIQAYHDRDRNLFMDALRALGDIGGDQARAVLVETLRDEDRYARNFAAKGLEKSGWRPKDRQQRIRYLLALDKWDEAVAAGPAAKPNAPGANQAMGPFELGIPTVIAIGLGDEHRPKSLGYPCIQFAKSAAGLSAALAVDFSSWPRTKWLMSIDLLDTDRRALGHAEAAHVTSGTIMRVPLVEPAEIPFHFGRKVDPAKVAQFRFAAYSASTDQGNPLVFDKELPLSLAMDTTEASRVAEAKWVQFERSDKGLFAAVRVRYLSWPKATWLVRVELRGPQDRVLARAEQRFESAGVIIGVPEVGEQTFRLSLGQQIDLPERVRYVVYLERVTEVTVSDAHTNAMPGRVIRGLGWRGQ